MTHSISVLYIYAADLWSVQQTSAHQLTSYCLSFTLSTHEPTMSHYISELDVSLNAAEEQKLKDRRFTKIGINLNEGTGGKEVYLWFKHGSVAITKVQVSFDVEMTHGLNKAKYTKVENNLNDGAGGSPLYLWYSQGSGEFDTPIVGLEVTTVAANEAGMLASGWERVACDLNRGNEGNWIHLWLKRDEQTYICDVIATDSFRSDMDLFQKGYIRVDEDANRGAGGASVFIWFHQTSDPERALKDLQVSITDAQSQEYQKKHYEPVGVDLNEGAGGNKVNLWHKKEGSSPIKAIGLLLNKDAVKEYPKAGIRVILRNLNAGNKGRVEYLYVYQ